MKRIIILFVAAMCLAASNQVQGQNKGEMAAGVQFAFGAGSEFGLNVGGGVDFQLTDKWVINIEPKYKISGSWGRFVATAGVVYKF